eukprot:4351426-Prymnesium_polylepis.1
MALIRWKDSKWWPSWKRALKGNNLSAELREEARRLRGRGSGAWRVKPGRPGRVRQQRCSKEDG